MKILSGDIGGTNTRLAVLAARADGGFEELAAETLPSRGFASLEDAMASFRREQAADCEVACLGVAGPVIARRCEATNLPWVIDAAGLERTLGLRRVELLNDLEAQAYGIGALGPEDLLTLHEGTPLPGNAALIAAGTGLGQAGLFYDPFGDAGRGRLRPFATEGGHTDFAPRSRREYDLLCFLQDRYGRVSCERILSGPGLVNLFDFVVEVDGLEPDHSLRERMAAGDPAAEVSAAALSGTCPAADRALDFFVELYGAEAGNLALKMMSRAGIYIGGGIAPKILERLRSSSFLDSFHAKGRMRPVLEAMPITVLLEPDTALLGAAQCAVDRLG